MGEFKSTGADVSNIIVEPTAREVIVNLLQKYGHKTGQDAVNYVLNLFEPIKVGEQRKVKKVQNSKGIEFTITEDLHAQRIDYLFSLYLLQTKEMQDLIKGARAENIFWRGDEQKFFIRLVKQTQVMREVGVDKYRQQALKALSEVQCG